MRATAVLDVSAAVVLALAAGAMLAEGAILVPYWRSLPPRAFLDWYAANASRLVEFFGPLEVASAILALLAAASHWYRGSTARGLFALAAGLAVAVLATFPVYFRDVNAAFAAGTIAVDRVPDELARWALWHWGRTTAGIVAAVAAAAGGHRETDRAASRGASGGEE